MRAAQQRLPRVAARRYHSSASAGAVVQTELSREVRGEPIGRIGIRDLGQQRQRLGLTTVVDQQQCQRVAGAARQRRSVEQLAQQRFRPCRVALGPWRFIKAMARFKRAAGQSGAAD